VPFTVEGFLEESYGKAVRHIEGRPGRFAHLLPWSRVNSIVREQQKTWFHPTTEAILQGKLALGLEGAFVPPALLMREVFLRGGGRHSRFDPVALNHYLRRGATLGIFDVDQLSDPGRGKRRARPGLTEATHRKPAATRGSIPG